MPDNADTTEAAMVRKDSSCGVPARNARQCRHKPAMVRKECSCGVHEMPDNDDTTEAAMVRKECSSGVHKMLDNADTNQQWLGKNVHVESTRCRHN